MTGGPHPVLGVVVPTLNEREALPLLLEDLTGLGVSHRVLVVDGGSTDGTLEVARKGGAAAIRAVRGRASQMNTGALALGTPWILFVHADVRIPPPALRALETRVREPARSDFATFSFGIDGSHWFWRFIEFGQGIRERVSGLVYGDQGLLVPRKLLLEGGGFPDIPLMEDVEVLRSLRKRGSWKRIPEPILTSPRRYREGGRWAGWLRNTTLITLYLAGVAPEKLAELYPARGMPTGPLTDASGDGLPGMATRSSGSGGPLPRKAPGGPPGPQGGVVLVFAKEPVPGKVKTRLARRIGHPEAARVYRRLGRAVADGLRASGHRILVCFDPPEALPAMAEWLNPRGLEFLPQGSGDLGARLTGAFREGFRRGGPVLAVGTDAPDVDAPLLGEAFRKLEDADLVLGPARDGGYYLLGLRKEEPDLFRDIPWSTSTVLSTTLERALALGLRVSTLPVLSDVDTWDDLRRIRWA